jgi:hypothetical protein
VAPVLVAWLSDINIGAHNTQGVPGCQPVPGGYRYGELALQVGGVSDEALSSTGFRPKWLFWKGRETIYSKLQTSTLVREGATK